MNIQFRSAKLSSVGEFLIFLYCVVAQWRPEMRLYCDRPSATFFALLSDALSQNDDEAVLAAVCEILPISAEKPHERGLVLAVLEEFDRELISIHPRSMVVDGVTGAVSGDLAWLRSLSEVRREQGFYAEYEGFRLIPRGPLARLPRSETATSAESLADRFVAISVVAHVLEHDMRTVSLRHIVVTSDRIDGVEGGGQVGSERVVHFPLAIDDAELKVTSWLHGSRSVMSYEWVDADGLIGKGWVRKAAEIFLDSVVSAGAADILIAPEFVVDYKLSREISNVLSSAPVQSRRLVVAGSGCSEDQVEGLPYNEVRVLNGLGKELWVQRKVWPAHVDHLRASEQGFFIASGCVAFEATGSGSEIVIADVERLGRCVILICQDIKLFSANSLLNQLQCDWVITPIMDSGVDGGRWSHRATFGLSEDCQTRFLVGSSLSLVDRKKGDLSGPCLMAVGPRDPADASDTPRAVALRGLDRKGGVRYAELRWREGEWKKSCLSANLDSAI